MHSNSGRVARTKSNFLAFLKLECSSQAEFI